MLISVLFNFFIVSSIALECLDDNNKPVDWIIAYKFPAIKHDKNPLISHGIFYMYMTSSNYSGWIPSSHGVNSTQSFLNNILTPYYENKEKVSYLFYNDETPNNGVNNDKGHTKGVVFTNTDGGFWLIHSVPKFPPTHQYNFPESGMKFGQSFLCMSLDLENLDEIGVQLQYNEPNIYLQHIESDIKNKLPNLVTAAANVTVKNSPWYHLTTINTTEKLSFHSFAKTRKFAKDLYVDWVAPVLKTNLLVETWPDGPGRLKSDCTKPYKVKNIESIFVSIENMSFNSTHDHSKWAISDNNSLWTCIGDINRAEHQEMRGGGTVCLRNEIITRNYRQLVKYVEECEK